MTNTTASPNTPSSPGRPHTVAHHRRMGSTGNGGAVAMRAGIICWSTTSATRPIRTPITSAPSRHLHVGRSPDSRQTPAIFKAQNQMKPIATVMTPTTRATRRSVDPPGVSNAWDSEGAGPASQKLRAMAPSVSGSTIQTITAVRRTYQGASHFAPSDLLSRLLRLYGS